MMVALGIVVADRGYHRRAPSTEPGWGGASTVDSDFAVSISVDVDGSVRLAISGEVDIAVSDRLRRALVTAGSGAGVLNVDLTHLGFIDSSGLAALVRYGQELAGNGGRLRVVGASHQARRVLEIAGLISTNPAFDVDLQ